MPDKRLGLFLLGSLLLHLAVVSVPEADSPAGTAEQGSFRVHLLARHGDRSALVAESQPVTDQQSARAEAAADSTAESQRSASEATVSPEPVHSVRAAVVKNLQQDKSVAVAPAQQRSEINGGGSGAHPDRAIKEQPVRTSLVAGAPAGSVSYGQHTLTSAARHSRLREALFKALLPTFDYPNLARRRGWQGRARVGLHVEHDGDLKHIYLVESSGHDILDKAAIKNITALGRVPEATQWLDSEGMDIVLPVSYRLSDR